MSENTRTLLLEMLLSGFFAVAWLRACVPAVSEKKLSFGNLLRLSGRLERLKRTRWQWFAMVGLMLVLRLQGALPPTVEAMALLEFILFLALPSRLEVPGKVQGRRSEVVMGSR